MIDPNDKNAMKYFELIKKKMEEKEKFNKMLNKEEIIDSNYKLEFKNSKKKNQKDLIFENDH